MLRVAIARGKDPDEFFNAIKASQGTTLVLDLSSLIKFTGPLLQKLTLALPPELEELDLHIASSPAAKEGALVSALLQKVGSFPCMRSFLLDGVMPKHPLLLKARIDALKGPVNVVHTIVHGLGAELLAGAVEAIAKHQPLKTVR